ncbi:MAG: hypothetical protein ACRCW1_10335, partial [Anaerotignaceae bacterium]
TPKLTFSVFDLEFINTTVAFKGTQFTTQGMDIYNLLKTCHKAVLVAATLGQDFETRLRIAQVKNMSEAIILDSCGSSAIENICDNFQNDIEAHFAKENQFITSRFSIGYGDFPLENQKDFCKILNTEKFAGITVNNGGLLVPTKSVTAIIGISNQKQPKRKPSCENCNNFFNCSFRKDGITCD